MKKICLILFSLLLLGACSDSDEDSKPKPVDKNEEFPVHLSLNLTSGGEDGILSINMNTTKVFTEPRITTDTLGYKGIVMYSTKEGQLSAFDLACPYCWNGNILTQTNIAYSYECKVCGLDADLGYGKGYFWNESGKISKSVDLVKYKVTKLETGIYLVTNPSK